MKNLIYVVALSTSLLFLWSCQEVSPLPPGDPDNGGLFLPGGFEALVVADSIGPARHLAVSQTGDIYVKLRKSRDDEGGNVAIRDLDGDGKADVIKRFGDYLDEGGLANGMTIHEDFLYYSSARVVYRQKLVPGELIPSTDLEIILTDDHAHGTHWHITKPMSFDDQGNMFVPFGTPSNSCQDLKETPEGVPGIPGMDPCPELELHGGIWKFDASRQKQTQADGQRYATGVRSVLAMDWNEMDKSLYVVIHGRDDLHRLFPNIYSPWQSAMLPSEEFVRVREGADYGWPYCFYDQLQGKKVLAPEYGGDGRILGRCIGCEDPIMGFPGHWAPNDLYFYRGDQFPDRYKHGAFIAFHGSTNRAPYPQAGYFVCFVPFENGEPTGAWEVFADGFAGVDPIVSVSDARRRPMGLAEGPDGSLYLSDSRKGRIWRIMFKGGRSSFGGLELKEMEKRKTLSHIRTPHEMEDNLQREIRSGAAGLYIQYCSPCHQGDGKGAAGRFPTLVGTDWVLGDPDRLIGVVLNGLSGAIEVNGEPIEGVMPPHDFLSDQQVADVLTYVRTNFGNQADPITAERVERVRNTPKPGFSN